MRLKLVTAACLFWSGGSAFAEDFIEGVWLPTAESCEQAQASGIEGELEEGNLVLTASGLHGYEFHCDFLQVLKGTRTPGWTVTALCEEPGFAFSDLITVMPRSEGQIDLTSMALRTGDDGEEADSSGGLHHYVRCEGVDLP